MGTRVQTLGGCVVGLLLTGCSNGPGTDPGTAATGSPDTTLSARPSAATEAPPKLGGELGPVAVPPRKAMNRLERPIASQLGERVVGQGLTLRYLDCPRWNGKAPQLLTCEGYLDGVTADVRVRLTKTTTSVNFDADLQDGVLATANLVRQLKSDGYQDIDCGDVPAYPTKVGSKLTCAVSVGGAADRGIEKKYVVAIVLDRSGTVEISDY